MHVDPDHITGRRESQLFLAGEQHVPCLVLLKADHDVLAIGAAPSVGSRFVSGAGQAVVAQVR
jgi:hypothetical protein